MDLEKKIDAFSSLGERLRTISSGEIDAETERVIATASSANPWFTRENILKALGAIGMMLTKDDLEKWITPYKQKINSSKEKKIVGVVNAGNIPAVGFHDFLCVLMSGNIYHGKNSADDTHLLPFIASLLKKAEPEFESTVFFVERISNPHAMIATGSNNSARYFEYYFKKYPHIIRRNRNGIAVLDGTESDEELAALADDVFQYFGLGCRSVSKIFIPDDYDVRNLFGHFSNYDSLRLHHRYMNNYDYSHIILLMKKIQFYENGFVILREETSLHSPIAVLHYEYYKKADALFEKLSSQAEEVQCVSCGNEMLQKYKLEKLSLVPFGQTQKPELRDYADGVDTMEFLVNIK